MKHSLAWYEEFFDEYYLRSYRPRLALVDSEKEAEFVMGQLRLQSGMRLLDICCGQGRHAVPLARRGLRVAGLDLSARLLAEAEKAAREAGVSLELVRRDMRDIPWTGEFDGAINMFTAFGYFDDDEENFRVLEGMARALKPGGRFCLDVMSYSWLLRHYEATGWSRGEGDLLELETRRVDWMTGYHAAEVTLVEPDGARKARTTRLRLFAPHELVAWLRRAGLTVEALFGDLAGSPFGLDTPRLVLVGRK
jgi:SAM-dependent methyltransferase